MQKSFNCTFDFLPSKKQKNQSLLLFMSCLYGLFALKYQMTTMKYLLQIYLKIFFSSDDLKYTVGLRYFHAIIFLDFISLMILKESHANFS
jgi:hypothetical protein